MLKKFFIGALLAIMAFGTASTSEAHHYNYGCRDGYCAGDSYCGDYCNDGDYYRGRGCGCR